MILSQILHSLIKLQKQKIGIIRSLNMFLFDGRLNCQSLGIVGSNVIAVPPLFFYNNNYLATFDLK